MERTRPERLRPGARIGVVSPAYWLEDEQFQRAVGVFQGLGYEVIGGHCAALRKHRFAGTPGERAAEIMGMFEDSSIDAIICARGGYGGNRVLPLLDYGAISRNPKIFVGFSDITGFLASLAQRSGLVTFHGPMMATFGKKTLAYNVETLQQVLSGGGNIRVGSPEGCRARTLRAGRARGPLWGGNLSLVCERLGTAGQIDTRGCVLFLEEIGEKPHAFDRMMLHLRNSGCLDGIAGLVIGEMLEMDDSSKIPFGKDLDGIVLDICDGLDIPIISNFPCGHGDYQATLPVSHDVVMYADEEDPFILIPDSPVS
jgi:muramoyltetrapeptide carboxypeptidase